jgi:hypothetical protein
MIRAPFLIGATANTPRPCTGELRTSTSGDVTMGGPPLLGCAWVDMSMGLGFRLDLVFVFFAMVRLRRAP